MLENIFGKSKEKVRQEAMDFFNKASGFLEKENFSQASDCLEKAVELDADAILPLMEPEFEAYEKKNYIREALILGSILFRHKTTDCKLANRVGNLHRRLGENKKANDFYKKAVSLNRKYDIALWNLAASMAKVPKYDNDLKRLISRYIDFSTFLIPGSTYPRDPRIIDHLTEILNMTAYFSEVDKIQEMILTKALQKEEPDLDKINSMVEKIKAKFNQRIQFDLKNPNVPRLLKESLEYDWNVLSPAEKDSFLWGILNLGLFILKDNHSLNSETSGKSANNIKAVNLQIAMDCFMRLKAENYSYKYLDMIAILNRSITGDRAHAIDEMKALTRSDPNDRYYNVNLGLLYHLAGNTLMSLVYLLKGANVLEELNGACDLAEIIALADEKYKEGKLKKALRLYQIASLETDSIHILFSIGQILISLHRYYQAIQPFKEVLRIDPESKQAEASLQEIQDHFVFLADEFYRVADFNKAIDTFEKALEVKRTPEILKKTMKACKMYGDHNKAYALRQEYQNLLQQKEEEERELKRKQHVEDGLNAMKSQDFQQAISHFNEAFKLKKDKDVFMYLSYLYKKFNHRRALQELMKQWKIEQI